MSRLLRLPPVAGRFIKTAYRDNILFFASALSFDGLLAAIPLALLFIALIGFVFKESSAAEIDSVLQVIMPAHSSSSGDPLENAQVLIERVIGSRGQLSLYGLPLFLIFSTRLFASVRIALNQILHTKVQRHFLHAVGIDVILVIITTVLFAANSFVTIPVFDFTIVDQLLGHLLAIAFGTLLFFLVYTIAPDQSMPWDTGLIAAIFAALGFEGAKILFSFYLAEVATIDRLISNENAIAAILFVFWIYYVAVIFLLGAEVAKAHLVYKKGLARRETEERQQVST